MLQPINSAPGLSQKAQDSLNLLIKILPASPIQRALRFEDFMAVGLLLSNHSRKLRTVTKHVIEATGRAPGTIRRLFREYESHGWVRCVQKIGRSEIYEPTSTLLDLVNLWGETAWTNIQKATQGKR